MHFIEYKQVLNNSKVNLAWYHVQYLDITAVS